MSQTSSPPATAPRQSLPRNVKVLGLASLLNDIASEMIFPLLPNFLLMKTTYNMNIIVTANSEG